MINTELISYYAIISAFFVAVTAAPLGCFIVWRKMAYFSDALSHSALLGVALGLIFNINTNIAILIVCIWFSSLLLLLQHKKTLAGDSIMVILMSTALALGSVLIKHYHNQSIELEDILFGKLENVTNIDLYLIIFVSVLVVFSLITTWKSLIITTISEELSLSDGNNVFLIKLIFTLLITLTTAVSVRIVGVLLITSLMIIPAATARQISNSPKQMAIYATVIAVISVNSGIMLSTATISPIGPSIVLCAATLFTVVMVLFRSRN